MKRRVLVKPFLKWAGGKRQLLGSICERFPSEYSCYYEPFVGAGAVFLHLQARRAVVNDSNEQLMQTYSAVKDSVDELIDLLRQHERNNSSVYYYRIREQDRDSERFAAMSPVQKAARLIYLNKTCYNGLYRVNAQGLFNVPYGSYKAPVVCEDIVLRAISQYLNEADIRFLTGDFADAVRGAGRGSLVYFDPPYHSPNGTNFTGYQADGFGESEQRRLKDEFARLTELGAFCVLSNSATDFVRELYKEYPQVIVQAARPINADAAARGKVDEILVWSR